MPQNTQPSISFNPQTGEYTITGKIESLEGKKSASGKSEMLVYVPWSNLGQACPPNSTTPSIPLRLTLNISIDRR